ncbi:MAG: acyl-CoA thioester hydrolase [Miltoncostaeaceae bacterium]|jgi:acyl-CoA thioester hydrolase|nr:acyl-CoA thioester hydrolase [Miltoncostaeaceae bacterium]
MPPHVHTHRFRVVMAEVDASQIHFTAIFRWMDRGMSEWLAAIGRPFTYVLSDGPGLPIVDARCRFLGRIMLDDELTLSTYVAGVGNTSFRTRHDFARGDEIVAAGELVHVCVDRPTRTPVPVPDWIREHEVADPPVPDAG